MSIVVCNRCKTDDANWLIEMLIVSNKVYKSSAV